jgi:hypothetical protein
MRYVTGEADRSTDPPRLLPSDRAERAHRRPISRRWLAALLALAALADLYVGVAGLPRFEAAGWAGSRPGGVAVGPRADPAPVPVPRGGVTATSREAAVRTLLDRHARALLARDRAGWLAGVDPTATAFRTRQGALFDNLAGVPLSSWRYVLDAAVTRELPPAASRRYRSAAVWVPSVTLRYALQAVDAEATDRPQVLTFVSRAGRWYLAADGDTVADGGRTWRGLWDFGPVVAVRGRSSLLLAHPTNVDRLAAFVDAVDAAVPRVTAVWGPAWPKQVAVLIPDTNPEMAALVGEQFALARIAAVSIADYADAQTGKARGQRVVINPANLDRLGSAGRRIVLQHEITHIASRGVTGAGMPTWLVEGFADLVGYRDSGVPATVIGQDLRALVRRGAWPGRLPADRDFHGDSARLAAAYEEAWSACRLIAARIGVPGLVRFYRQVGTAPGDGAAAVDAALRQFLHLSTAQFVAQWRQAVRTEFG